MILLMLEKVREGFLEMSTFCFDFYCSSFIISSNQTQYKAVKASGIKKACLSGSAGFCLGIFVVVV